ncbi:BNR-4 repeat-containing protein [Thalassotalea agariperforans]
MKFLPYLIFFTVSFLTTLLAKPVFAETKQGAALKLLAEPVLLNSSLLVSQSHNSDGSDRAKNGKVRFTGPLGAQAVTYKGYQYAIYYTAKNQGGPGDFFGEVVVARRKAGTDDWQHATLPAYRLTSDDAHNRQTIAISKGDGVIHIAFDHHNHSRINYAHTAKGVADDPESVDWNDEVFNFNKNLGFNSDIINSVTYPTFHQFPGGNLLLYYRNGGAVKGEMQIARYDAKQSKWLFVRRVSSREGTFFNNVKGNKEPSTRGPYSAGGPKIDNNGVMHLSWLFRERAINCNIGGTDGGRDCNHGMYYSYSTDEGSTWFSTHGKLLANTNKGETISVETKGAEVVHIPTTLMPSNVSHTSAIDKQTGEYHVLLEHKTSVNGASKVHHYVRDINGDWHTKISNFSASDVTMTFIGDTLFAFAGRSDASIYYATRDNDFANWQQINLPALIGKPSKIEQGYITWDLSLLANGMVSVLWHRAPEGGVHGKASPIYVYDYRIAQ